MRHEIPIDLDRDDPTGALDEPVGENSPPRSDFDHRTIVDGPKRLDDSIEHAFVTQKVLPEALARRGQCWSGTTRLSIHEGLCKGTFTSACS